MDAKKEEKAREAWYTGSSTWPNVFIRKSQRSPDFYKAAIDYAIERHKMRGVEISHISQLKDSYNGITSGATRNIIAKMDALYDGDFHARYKDYNISKRKADQLLGEFIESPISGTVYAINNMALTEKQEVQDIINGMKAFKQQVQKLRDEKLADPFDGYTPPDEADADKPQSVFQRMSGKTKNEFVMQKFVDEQIKIKNIKDEFSINVMDAILANDMFGKVELDTSGKAYYRPIDCRRRMSEELEGDIHSKKSPYMGEQRWMYVNEIIEEWPQVLEDKKMLDKIFSYQTSRDNSDSPVDDNLFMQDSEGGLLVNTHTIEMYCYDTTYFKQIKKNDDKDNEVENYILMDSEYVEKPKRLRRMKNEVKNGKYELLEKVKKTLCSVTRIGADIYLIHGEVPFIIGSYENPYDTEYNYCSTIFGTQNGKRTSIFEALEDVKFEYNLCRMIINRELFKSKGLAMAYDRAFLPKIDGTQTDMNKVMTKIVNDGIIDYTTANDAHMDPEVLARSKHLDVVDMGMSKMVTQIIQIAYDLERAADAISGLNKERQGNTPATQTATTAGNNLLQSRAVTAPVFYFVNRFIAEVLRKLCERRKVGIAYIELEDSDTEAIIGHEAIGYIKAEKDVAKYDYAYYIGDGRKEMIIRQSIREYIPNAIQSGELRPQDAVMIELQETLAEVYETMDKGWNVMKKMAAEREDKEMQSMIAQQQQKLEAMIADREDKQKHEAALEALKGEVKLGLDSMSAMNQYNLNAQEQMHQKQMEESVSQ